MNFGIDREMSMDLDEIGEELNMTVEQVQQIKEKAFSRLGIIEEIKK